MPASSDTAPNPTGSTGSTGLDTYIWPTCAGCHRDLTASELGRHACRICQRHAAEHLNAIRTLYPALATTSALMPGTTGDRTRTGNRTSAPIPVNVAVLSLTATGGASTRLQAIEDAWKLALGRRIPVRHDRTRTFAAWRANPAADVPEHVDFLLIHLGWACENYPEIAQDLAEIRTLHAQCKGTLLTAVDPAGHSPNPVPIGPCPAPLGDTTTPCRAPLTAAPSAQAVHCSTCGTSWDGVLAWIALRRAQAALTTTLAAA